MGNDLKFALRTMARSPGFTVVAVLTLALGIGANTSVFTVANGLLLRPLDYFEPDRLIELSFIDLANGTRPSGLSFPVFQNVLERNRSFSGLAAFCNESLTLTGLGEPEQLQGARVSWNFFGVLGVRPALGRWFSAAEDHAGGGDVTIVSHDFWTRRMGGAPDAVGRTITLDAHQYTVIGVLPPGFRFSLLGTTANFWLPRVDEISLLTPEFVRRGSGYLSGIGRLAPGVQRENALAEMAVINLQFRADHPGRPDANPRLTLTIDELQGRMVANVRTAVLLLTGAVGVVLLIACANVASLLLSRALGRRKEIALRGALGAGRWRLLRQLLTESLLLAFAGGTLGILFGRWGTAALQALGSTTLPNLGPLHMDGRVLAFTLGVSLISGAIFGLAPALASSRPDLNAVLRDESRSSTGGRGGARARGALVIAQVALSMMLLVASGLLIRSFYELRAVNPGFDPAHLLTMRVVLSPSRYSTPAKMIAFYDEALRRVRAVPGVLAASISSAQPANPTRLTAVLLEGQPQVPLGQRPVHNIQMLSPDWATTLRVPLIRGREFTPHDNAQAPPVALVNQALARRYWPNENAIGKKVFLGYIDAPWEVVGLVGDVKNTALAAEPQPEVLIPYPQRPWAILNLTVRTPGDPLAMASSVRHEVAAVDPEQAITNVQSMEDILDAGRIQTRFTMFLLGGFAAAALGLSLVGIYGAISYSVAQRTRELGIRVALGASRSDILRLALGHGIRLALVGIAAGLAGAAALTRVLSGLLYRTSATDPLTLALSAMLFLAAALAAGYVPARRAMRIDPGDALRYE